MEIFPGGSGLSPSKEVNKGEIIILTGFEGIIIIIIIIIFFFFLIIIINRSSRCFTIVQTRPLSSAFDPRKSDAHRYKKE